jgi:hypothetical protein
VHTDMEMWNEVRRRVLVEGASKRSMRREYRIGSETLAKILANPEPPGYRLSAPRPRPKVGEFLAVIDEILETDRTAPPKQRHTSKRIFERLRDEYGYTGGITQVKEAVAAARLGSRESFVPVGAGNSIVVLTCGDAALQRVPQSSSWRPSVPPRSFPDYPPAGWPHTTWVRIGSEGPLPRSPHSPSGHREKAALPDQTLARPRTWVRRRNGEGLPRSPYSPLTALMPSTTSDTDRLRRLYVDQQMTISQSRRVTGRCAPDGPQPVGRQWGSLGWKWVVCWLRRPV